MKTKPYSSTLLAEALTPFRKGIGFPPKGYASTEEDRLIEGVVHEMAHLAVFGIRAYPEGIDLGVYVSNRFHEYIYNHASDRSELHALLVERRVLFRLRVRIHWNNVLGSVILRQEESTTAFKVRRRLAALDAIRPHLAEERAATVRSWIDEAVRQYRVRQSALAVVRPL